MKKLAVASLGLALCMGGAVRAQAPYPQPAAQPIEPVAATATPQLPPGGVAPVRIHIGGALTKDGVVPTSVYFNRPLGPINNSPAPATRGESGSNSRPVSALPAAKGATAPGSDNAFTPVVTDPRFAAPNAGDMRAQGPFVQPAVQPIEPVAATAAPQLPPGGIVPVRVHFGGALTKDGVVPVPMYLDRPPGPIT